MKVDGYKADATVQIKGSIEGRAVSVKAGTEKASFKVDEKEITVVRKGHGNYAVKMNHIHHGDHVTKKAAREVGEQAIKTVRKAARKEVRKHK